LAKPKRKTKSSREKNPATAKVDTEEQADAATPSVEASRLTGPVTRRPVAFKISLALFIAWLIFLAYLAYKVST
jgi:hypothetical protein